MCIRDSVITDQQVHHEEFDHVVVLKEDHSQQQEWKLNNEWQVFELTPFKHTIKLEADMLFTHNTDWWWNHLHQHNLIFSYDCRSYSYNLVTRTPYRNLFDRNGLPNVYSAMIVGQDIVSSPKYLGREDDVNDSKRVAIPSNCTLI